MLDNFDRLNFLPTGWSVDDLKMVSTNIRRTIGEMYLSVEKDDKEEIVKNTIR